MIRKLVCLVITVVIIKTTLSSPMSSETLLGETEKNITAEIFNNTNDNLDDLINQQTDSVKQIVSEQKEQVGIDYPIVTKQVPQYVDTKKEVSKETIEELKIKCQHLTKLFSSTSSPNLPSRFSNHKFPDVQMRPVYIPKPTFRPKYPTTSRPHSFYITQTAKPKPTPVNVQPAAPIKYIRLEPVILQKTILNDGRTMYYWHKSLPTAVEYPNNYSPASTVSPEVTQYQQNYGSVPLYEYGYPVQNSYGYSPAHSYYTSSKNGVSYAPAYQNIVDISVADKNHMVTEATTTTTTSTTEGSSYSGYGLSNFIPFYSLTKHDTTSTTTEPTTTSNTTPKPTIEKLPSDDLLYTQQLKFVIPVPYEGLNSGSTGRYPWDFDPYAYYPKELQPNAVNVQIPYSPTFHMIRAVAIPKPAVSVNGRSDEVSIP